MHVIFAIEYYTKKFSCITIDNISISSSSGSHCSHSKAYLAMGIVVAVLGIIVGICGLLFAVIRLER